MVVSKKKNNPECKLFSKGEQIRQVQKFKYLGYTLTSDGKCRTEIKKRIAIAKASFQKMSTILKNRNISFSTKLKVLKTYVWSILLYRCETWTITAGTKKNLEAAEMWFYRRMLRIAWKEKRTNESILEETNQERSLIKTIRKRQLKFLGHICRHKGLEFLSLTGKIEGTRSRGRQRITFLDSLSSFVTGNNKDNIALLRMTEDRDRWRIMIADVCSRQGIWERDCPSYYNQINQVPWTLEDHNLPRISVSWYICHSFCLVTLLAHPSFLIVFPARFSFHHFGCHKI